MFDSTFYDSLSMHCSHSWYTLCEMYTAATHAEISRRSEPLTVSGDLTGDCCFFTVSPFLQLWWVRTDDTASFIFQFSSLKKKWIIVFLSTWQVSDQSFITLYCSFCWIVIDLKDNKMMYELFCIHCCAFMSYGSNLFRDIVNCLMPSN